MPRKLLLGVVLATVLTVPSFGQTFGEIRGVVYDSTGAVVPGVTITITNPQTNFTRTALSNETGNYNFPALLPGVYNVKAELSGFQSEARNSVELQVQQIARIDFRLNVGAVTDTVEVSAGAPLLNTENATLGTVIENKRIVDLPLNGRSFVSLIALSPNVITGQTSNTGWTTLRGNADRGNLSISIAGLRREYTYYTLDGVANTDVDWNSIAYLPSIDALQEFKVQTGIYSAEFGRAATVVNLSTKSGTNELHGTVFEFLRNNKLDARPYAFTSQVPVSAPFKWNQYGFAVGGPILKDRLFFMSNYEGFKLRNRPQQVFSVPSAAMRRGDFLELLPTTVIRDPLNNNQPFPGNIIPTNRLHRVAVGLLNFSPTFYPEPNVSGAGLVNNYLGVYRDESDKNQFTQRIDWTENAKSSWLVRYSQQDDTASSAGPPLSSLILGSPTHTVGNWNTNVKQATISNTRIFKPNVVNEARVGYMGYHNAVLAPLAYKRDVDKEVGIQLYHDLPPISWGVPLVTFPGFSGFGDNYNAPYETFNHTFQLVDNISWIRGAHTIKLGGEVRRDRYNPTGGQVSRGQLQVQNQATGYGFADFMLGYLQSGSATSELGIAQFRATSQAYYINDNWKARPNLSIEAGLRYEYLPVWNNKGDSLMNVVVPDLSVVTTPNPPLDKHAFLVRDCAGYGQKDFWPPTLLVRYDPAMQQRCDSSKGNNFVDNDRRNFAPRLGLAWTPTPKLTVRAGFGIFYVKDQGNTYFDAALNMAGKSTATRSSATTNDLTMDNPLAAGRANVCGVPTPPYACIVTPVVLGNDPNRRTPYLEQYELNIQRELSGSTVLEVGYLGSQGHKLERPMLYNEATPCAGTDGRGANCPPVTARQPFPEFGLIQITMSNTKSNYHSGSFKLTRRLSKGLSYMAGYTYSKSLDTGSAIRSGNTATTTHPQIGHCVECEYGPSDFDSRHRFVTSALYELPFGKGHRFLNEGVGSYILGGWQLNSIVTKSSGFPIELLDGINRSNGRIGNNRPDAVVGVSRKLDHPTTDQWFNVASIRLQPFGQYGNLARNSHVGPGVATWDFSALKKFNLSERTNLQFRFECFNCANHPNFGDPGNLVSSSTINADGSVVVGGNFGRIASTRPGFDMRQLQFGLKLLF